jgi:hypothetical protein
MPTSPAASDTPNLDSLKQAAAQVNSVIEMLETNQCPLEIARTLNSLEKEIIRLKRAFVDKHRGASDEGRGWT